MKYTLRKELATEEQEELKRKDREYYYATKPKRNSLRRENYKENKPRYYLNNKRSVLKAKYGLAWSEYQEMFERQNGVCAICKGTEEDRMLAVDHNHETDIVRGLLCGTCNRALGLFKDSPELLQVAKEYVS